MNQFTALCEGIGAALMMLWRAASHIKTLPRQFPRFIEQCHMIGYTTMPIVTILSFFIGGVLALQTGHSMETQGFGAKNLIGTLVGLSMCRELGPVMVAILVTGRVGSAITAELASMNVYQEIDALRTMNINPIHYLVLPRLVAIVCALPLLVVFSILIGWLAGASVCVTNSRIGVPYQSFFTGLSNNINVGDVANGLFKSFVFALVIGVVSCHQGLATIGGPRGIGRSVTKAVVNSIVLILILDYFLTRLLLYLD